jgi:hypothetical protein
VNLWGLFLSHQGRLMDKWAHYFPIYERHFARYIGESVRVLEIGVGHGGSLQLWKAYFGARAEIVGLDIDGRCKEYEEDRITIHIGDQANPPTMGRFDIVIDDGSHRTEDQSASFTRLWPLTDGVYLIEDCHHNYPALVPMPIITYQYPWVMVCERPQRVVAGRPSRRLNAAEVAAYG